MNKQKASFFSTMFTLILFTLFWLGFTEQFGPRNIVMGVVISFAVLLLTNKVIFRGENYVHKFRFSLPAAAKYIFYLLYKIYAAGLSALYQLIQGNARITIVEIDTDLQDDFSIALLANSITLTPGTVTVGRQGNKLQVIWLAGQDADHQNCGSIIKGDFEKILLQRNG